MKDYKIKIDLKKEIEAEEILFDSEKKKENKFLRLEVKIERSLLKAIFFLYLFLTFFLFLKFSYLIFAQGKYFEFQSKQNYTRIYFSEAPRGLIKSIDGEDLVENLMEKKILKQNGQDFEKIIYKRKYKDPLIFSPILGYLREATIEDLKNDPYYKIGDQIGKAGIEKTYEKYLRGEKGRIEKVIDAKGKFKEEFTKKTPPKQGKNIILNINGKLQRKLFEIFKNKAPQKKGGAIVVNPQNGRILALVSFPSDDTNIFLKEKIEIKEIEKLKEEEKIFNINRVVEGLYPSGSTIKPLIALAALEEGIIKKNTKIYCPGKIIIPNPWNPNFPTIKKDWKAHGITDLNKAIAQSCNLFFYQVGGGYQDFEGLGIQRIKKYLDLFYFEKKLNIDLPQEKIGFIPTPDWFKQEKEATEKRNWSIADVYDVSIGQGFLRVTPLHLAFSFLPFLNGGKIYQPQIVRRIEQKEGKVIYEFEPKILKNLSLKKENLELVKEAMENCVDSPSGSCHSLKALPVSSGGKTGSAETGILNSYYSWFLGFAPSLNPEILILVIVEKGEGGEKTALPIAKEFLSWYFEKK